MRDIVLVGALTGAIDGRIEGVKCTTSPITRAVHKIIPVRLFRDMGNC